MTARDGTAWANFWGTFSDTWGYKRSTDYDNIFTRTVSTKFNTVNILLVSGDISTTGDIETYYW